MAVLNPLKVTITNMTKEIECEAQNHPAEDIDLGSRKIVLTPTIYVDREDFREEASDDFYRLKPGAEVKLRWGVCITCNEVVKDKSGAVVELKCTHDPETLTEHPKGRPKPKGVVQWVSAKYGTPCTVRFLNPLLKSDGGEEEEAEGEDENKKDAAAFLKQLNPESLVVYDKAMVEPSLKDAKGLETFQFERVGFFAVDPKLSKGKQVFNRTVVLKESGLKAKESEAAQKRSRKDEQAAQAAAKAEKKKLDPKDMFKDGPYSKFDADGVPTHDDKGEELTKSAVKKLKKEWEKQKRLFES
jgi:glutaminyl-tRNA synthetase